MAKNTTSKVNPVNAEVTSEVTAAEKPDQKERKRTPSFSDANGESLSGLTWPLHADHEKRFSWDKVIAIENGRAQMKITRGQFRKIWYYYAYMSAKYAEMSTRYAGLSQDARENPEKYARKSTSTVKILSAKVDALVAKLAETMGITVEEAKALCEG